jgi:transposase
MSMHPREHLQIPEATVAVAQAAFPKGCLAMRVRDALGEVFADDQFAAAFGVRGRPGEAPGLLALVTVLQFAENLTDRQAADAVRGRIDWKYALALELADPGFDFTVLSGFRARLLEHGLEERVLDLLLQRCIACGLVKSGGRQRTDSTRVVAAVRSMNRLEFVGETLRAALEALAVAAPDWLTPRLTDQWRQRYGARMDGWRLPAREDEQQALRLQIGQDGYQLLAEIYAADQTYAWLAQLPAVETLRRIWIQQFQLVTDATGGQEVHWRENDNLPPGRLHLKSPYDLDARYSMKRDHGWTGYKIHLTETCDDAGATGRPHLITNVVTTAATTTDVEMTQPIHADLRRRDLLPTEHLVDAGYTSLDGLLVSSKDYGITLTGPIRADPSRQAATASRFAAAAFVVDFDARTATCPAGQVSSTWSPTRDPAGREVIRARFSPASCRPCPFRDQCTRDRTGVRQLTIRPRPQHEAQRAARAEQATDQWKQRYATRSGIEGTISQAVAVTGIRTTRYIGLAKTHLAHVFAATAINLIRLDAHWTSTRISQTRITNLNKLELSLAA